MPTSAYIYGNTLRRRCSRCTISSWVVDVSARFGRIATFGVYHGALKCDPNREYRSCSRTAEAALKIILAYVVDVA